MIDEKAYCNCILAEQSVIGHMIGDPEKVMPEAVMCLKGEDFLSPEYAAIFRVCKKLYLTQERIDPLIVARYADQVHKADYRQILYTAHKMVTSPSVYKEHIRLVADNAKMNRALEKTEILHELLAVREDMELCREATNAVMRCFSERSLSQTTRIGDLFVEFTQRKTKPVQYIETGFATLDKWTCISKGDYVVMGGRPSSGKTALTLQMALHMAKTHTVAYFTLETSKEKLTDRAVACKTGTELDKIKRAGEEEGLQLRDWNRIMEYFMEFSEMNLYVVPSAGWSVEQIKAETVRIGASVIFVDYLGLIDNREAKSMYEKVTQISLDLHTMAQTLGVTVFVLAQLNRSGKDAPDMTSLRDSGQIEQDADIILLLDGPESKAKDAGEILERELIIAKNKDGRTGAMHFNLEGRFQQFREVEYAQ